MLSRSVSVYGRGVQRSIDFGLRHFSSGRISTDKIYQKELDSIKEAGTYKYERIITSPQTASISVQNESQKTLNFCANNYLGLADNKNLIDAAVAAMNKRGHGMSSVRFICGTSDMHRELEKAIADFHGKDDAILYASCFDANAGIFETLLTPDDAVISDELNHASIIDGVRLCKAKKFRYAHNDMNSLSEKMKEAQDAGARIKLIVTDGAFSMDGDIAKLDEMRKIADSYENAIMMTDECHCSGFLGPTGRGSPELKGVEVEIINSTLGKALGGALGGFTASSQAVVDLLRQRSRPYLFSNALPPAVLGSTLEVFNILTKDSSLRERLAKNTSRFRTGMESAGFETRGHPDHPIVPIMLYDAKLASTFADKMLSEGIYVIGFSFPVVPRGQARIRVQLSAAHSAEDVDRAVAAFTKVGKELGVLK